MRVWPLIILAAAFAPGDDWCDPLGMTAAGQFDQGDCEASCLAHCSSACGEDCLRWDCTGLCPGCGESCTGALLGNNHCDSECDNEACAWDLGDCEALVVTYVAAGRSGGSGQLFAPYGDLAETFKRLWAPSNEIRLFPGTHFLDARSPYTELLVTPMLTATSIVAHCPIEPCLPPTIQLTANFTGFHVNHTVTFKHVRIVSAYSLKPACPSCTYCPAVNFDGETWKDDRGLAVNLSHTAEQALCESYHSHSFFRVQSAGSLRLEAVVLADFKQQLGSLIQLNCGSAVLTEVNFTNCQANQALVSAHNNAVCGSFVYQEGKITLLNNGYEYSKSLTSSPFLDFTGVQSVHLSNLTFFTNFAFSAALIELTNIENATINNCTFEQNFAKNGVIVITAAAKLELSNLTFYENGVFSGSLVTVLQSAFVLFRGLSFQHSSATQAILWLSAQQLPGAATLTDLEILSCSAQTSLHLSQLTSAMASSIQIQNFPGCVFSDLWNALIDTYSTYISQPASNFVVDCLAAVEVVDVDGLEITRSRVQGTQCPSGVSGMLLKVDILQLSECSFEDNVGLGALAVYTGNDLAFSGLVFRNNSNQRSRASACLDLHFSQPAALTLTQCLFDSNSALFSAVLYASLTHTLLLHQVSLLSNQARYTCAGVLFNPLSTQPSRIRITDSVFQGNSAGNNGVVTILDNDGMLDSNMVSLCDVQLSNCEFSNNTSGTQGACFTIGVYVQVTQASLLRNCTFRNNVSVAGSSINLSFQSGIVTVRQCSFYENSGGSGAAIMLLHFPPRVYESQVTIEDSYFEGNSGGSSVWIQGYEIMNTLYIKRCVFYRNLNGALRTTAAYINDESSVYTETISEEAGVVYIEVYGTMDVRNMTAYGNRAQTFHGGVFFACVHSYLTVLDSRFFNNYAADSGGVMYCDENCYCSLANSLLHNNTGGIGATIYISPGFLEVTNCSFVGNHALRYATVQLTRCFANITDCVFANNTCGGDSPGIVLSSSNISVHNCSFQDQTGLMGAFLLLIDHSTVQVFNSSFLRAASGLGGAIYLSVQSLVVVGTSLFEDCKSESRGGAIMAVSSSVQLSDCNFVRASAGIGGGIVTINDGSLLVSGCKFEQCMHGALLVEGSDRTEVVNCEFSQGLNEEAGAAAFSMVTAGLLQNNTFTHNQAERVGAVLISGSGLASLASRFQLIGNRFVNNTVNNGNGGALHVSNVDVLMLDSAFLSNSAPGKGSNGGAVVLLCEDSKWCNMTLVNNSFSGNQAGSSGGAIYWQGSKPTLNMNAMEGNLAIYGKDVASHAVTLAALSQSLAYLDPIDESPNGPVVIRVINVPSGQLFLIALRVGLFDDRQQLMRADNNSSGLLAAFNSSLVMLSGNVVSVAAQGILVFQEVTVVSEPGSTQMLILTCSAINESKRAVARDSTQYHSSVLIQVDFRPCIVGESRQGNVCYVCAAGTYSLDPALPCMLCPQGAICYGNSTMVPQVGYWRHSNETDKFLECLALDACLGSPLPTISPTGLCADGYSGNLCQVCMSGYSRTGRYNCSRCPNLVPNIVISILLILLALLGLALVVMTAIRSAQKAQSLLAVHVQIFMNYLQMVVVGSALNLNWPSFTRTFLNGQEVAGSFAEQLFSFGCLLLEVSVSPVSLYYTNVMLTSVLPLALFLLCTLVWLLLGCCIALQNKPRKIGASAVIILFILHPTITKQMFSMFACMDLEDGHLWLYSDLSLRCWDAEHIRQILILALPSITVWVIGLPALTLGVLIRKRFGLERENTKLMFCFLYKGYQRQRFYWEFVILYRKVALLTALVFLNIISVKVQSLTVLAILLIALVGQVQVQPFFDRSLNSLEAKSIVVTAVTIYSGLYYATNDISET